MCVLACRLELKWSQDKSIRKVFTCFVCVLMMWSGWGWGLERVQIFILKGPSLRLRDTEMGVVRDPNGTGRSGCVC